MRHLTPHRWMLRLALAATLLMVLVPPLGRLAGSGPATGAAHAVHDAAGHGSHGGHAAHGRHGAPAPPGGPEPAGTARHDCGYCPLLASMVPPGMPRPTLRHGHHHVHPALGAAEPLLPWRHPWGLGSRGPPRS